MGELADVAARKGCAAEPGVSDWDDYGGEAIRPMERLSAYSQLAVAIRDMRARAERLQEEVHAGTVSPATVEELEAAVEQQSKCLAEVSGRIGDATIRLRQISCELDRDEELLAEIHATRAQLRGLLAEVQASTPSPGPSVSLVVDAMGPCLPPGEEWQRIALAWADFVVRVRCGRVAAAPASSSEFELRAGGVGLLVSFTVENTDEGAVRHTIAAKRLLL